MSTFDPSGINVYPVGLLWRRVLDRINADYNQRAEANGGWA